MRRLERDRPSIRPVDTFSFKEVLRAASSPHVVITSIIVFLTGTLGFALSFFLPSIVNQLGFSATHTQLLSVGPFAAAFVGECLFKPQYLKAYLGSLLVPLVTLLTAWFSDRYTSRGIAVALGYLTSVAGFALYLRNVLVLCQVSCSKRPILIRRKTHIHVIRGSIFDGSRGIRSKPNPFCLDG